MQRGSFWRVTEVNPIIVCRLEEGADSDLDGEQQGHHDNDAENKQGDHGLSVTLVGLIANGTTGVVRV
ncbi:MAG: hypothetical protein ACRD1Q_03710 [Vicinamibacterales bacterium]